MTGVLERNDRDAPPSLGLDRGNKGSPSSVILTSAHWLRLNYDVPAELQPSHVALGLTTPELLVCV